MRSYDNLTMLAIGLHSLRESESGIPSTLMESYSSLKVSHIHEGISVDGASEIIIQAIACVDVGVGELLHGGGGLDINGYNLEWDVSFRAVL